MTTSDNIHHYKAKQTQHKPTQPEQIQTDLPNAAHFICISMLPRRSKVLNLLVSNNSASLSAFGYLDSLKIDFYTGLSLSFSCVEFFFLIRHLYQNTVFYLN